MLHVAPPPASLGDLIESAVIVEQVAAASVSRFPAMPRAMLTMGPGTRGELAVDFHGLSTRPASHVHERPFEACGLVLLPWTAARLMGPTTGPVTNAVVPWGEIAGRAEAERLDRALRRADAPFTRLALLQGSLLRVLTRDRQVRCRETPEALRHLCMAAGQLGARATGVLGWSERQLERRCVALLGMSPKQLQGLTRFHAVLAQVLQGGQVPDAQGALAAGYCDQSHLARDVRRYGGAPFRDLLPAARFDGEWWPLATQRLRPQAWTDPSVPCATRRRPAAQTPGR